jgi:hypothetical protein
MEVEMKKVVVLLLLVLVASYAINNKTRVQTVIQDDNQTQTSIAPISKSVVPSNPTPTNLILGRQDVVGYTTWDWQWNGPVGSICRYDPVVNCIHTYWMWCDGVSANRNENYNFYSFSDLAWNWPNVGTHVYTTRSGYGSFDYDPITGCGVPSTHHGASLSINLELARDQAPGAGLFEYSAQPIGFEWPMVGVTNNRAIHIAAISQLDSDSLWYIKNSPWNTWSTATRMATWGDDPMFPDHNIAVSKTSNKVAIMWVCSEDVGQMRGFYKLSTDGGNTWGAQTQIPFPPSAIVTPSFYITSLFGMFDNSDNLHIVADVSDGSHIIPVEIWHYCPTNTPAWTMVNHYSIDTLNLVAAVGYNALYACRPSIVQDSANPTNFYVAWEQFDSLNYEPTTTLARADIWAAELTNNGQTVTRKGRITDPNTTSKRFPVVGGIKNDTVFVEYMIDSIAGFELYSQGRATFNPVVLHRFHKNSLPPVGIEEGNPQKIYNFALTSATPNPSNFTTKIAYSLPTTGNVDLTVYDVLGRPVKTLVSGTKTAGEYNAIWNGRDNNGNKVQAGVYFYTLKTSGKSVSQKLVRTN